MNEADARKEIVAKNESIQKACDSFLTDVADLQKIVPTIKQTMELSNAVCKAATSMPSTLGHVNWDSLVTSYGLASDLYTNIKIKYPAGITAATTTGSALVSAAANNVSGWAGFSLDGDAQIGAWHKTYIRPLAEIQAQPGRCDLIEALLKKLHVGSETEFRQSVAEYHQCRAGTASNTAAATSMRNVLETIRGNLRALALRYEPGAKNKVTSNATGWAETAKIIGRGAPASLQVAELIEQEHVYDELHDNKGLTGILKNDVSPSGEEWDVLFGRYIGLLYTVLGLVDFRDGS